jgi:hypothetical protein
MTIRDYFGRGTAEQNRRELSDAVADHGLRIERLQTGSISAHPNYTAAPAGGAWRQGDYVRNNAPSELGSSPNKYVILGWSCVVSGAPGTWVECRCLTGN